MTKAFDEYIERNFNWWMKLSKERLGRAVHPNEGGNYVIENTKWGDIFYETIRFPEFVDTLDGILGLKNSQNVTPELMRGLMSNQGLDETYRRNEHNFHSRLQFLTDEGNSVLGRSLTADETKAVTLGAGLTELLGFCDNYATRVFSDEEGFYERLCKGLALKFPSCWQDKASLQRGKPFEGKEGYYFCLEHQPKNQVDRQCRVSLNGYGSGGVYKLDEWSNYALARFHGDGIGSAEFTRKLIETIKEQSCAAHFKIEQCGNVVGGVFYDPK